ncbi:MAG: HAMP domain-containing protein [Hyphomicrobiales bacterium]|nr:HAMP domain-containing protein [Hyphomicrobiales bacterium]
MTALGKLFRTTAFKLSAAYLLVFAIFAFFEIGYIAYNTRVLLARQHIETIDAEVSGLAAQYRIGGIGRLVRAIDRRSGRPGAGVYLVTDGSGRILAGNIAGLPPGVLDEPGLHEAQYERSETAEEIANRLGNDNVTRPREEIDTRAVMRIFVLPGGFRLLVGRDIGEREKFREIIGRVARWSVVVMILLAVFGSYFVSKRVLRRIDSVADTSRRIVAGDLTGRIPLAGTGDEFDRLGESLNTMLDRIETLMRGLTEVSDNIAHDLKTPLTRLRNRVEMALGEKPSLENYREALEATIAESDDLIRTFNALLMIARVEAGTDEGALEDLDVGTALRDVAELYEPVAEDAGVVFTVEAAAGLTVRANRELLGQAFANLIDNALKYAAPEKAGTRTAAVRIGAVAEGGRILVTIADNGPGIPEADRARVLERFVRLEASRSRPGSGLGLSLVAAVARYHGGTISLRDAEPGLEVVLDLPRAKGGTGA